MCESVYTYYAPKSAYTIPVGGMCIHIIVAKIFFMNFLLFLLIALYILCSVYTVCYTRTPQISYRISSTEPY